MKILGIVRIRKGCKYRFNPVLIDFGSDIPKYTRVTVGPVPGMPKAKTVNACHVHVYYSDGSHAGFVHVNSLENK
jgi:hypothetical protein